MKPAPTGGDRQERAAGRRGRRFAWLALAIAISPFLGAVAWLLPDANPVRALERRSAPLSAVLRDPYPARRPVERWRLVTAGGDTIRGLWRPAPGAARSAWTVVALGGIGTGERVALTIPPQAPIHVLALEWPWRGPRRMSPVGFLWRLPAIRQACLRAPASLALGLEAALRDPAVDRQRVAVLGASLGVPPALAALRLSGAPRAVVLVDGAADLGGLMRHELRRQGVPAWLAGPAAAIGFALVRPLEPRLHADVARGRAVLLMNARADERLPVECVTRLRAALPHAQVRWREALHIRPGQRATVAALTAEIATWLASLDASVASGPIP